MPSNRLQEAADGLRSLSHITYLWRATHTPCSVPRLSSNHRRSATDWLLFPSRVVVQATALPHHLSQSPITTGRPTKRAASSIPHRTSGHNQSTRCIPPIGIEQSGHPRCVQTTFCTLVHPLSRSSNCQMRAAVRSSRLHPFTSSSFRTRPSHIVFWQSSALSSIPRYNPLDVHNLFSPLVASPIITPRPHFASQCIPAPTNPIIHEPQLLSILAYPTPHFIHP